MTFVYDAMKQRVKNGFINPSWTKFFFSVFFGTYPKIGSFCLPTHSHDGHGENFYASSLKYNWNFGQRRHL